MKTKTKIVGFQVKQAAIMSMKYTSEGKIRVRTASVKLETGAKQGKERLPKPPQFYPMKLPGHRQKVLYCRQETS